METKMRTPQIKRLNVSICIPAYNEDKNISKILDALIAQKTKKIRINKIVIVSSGSTDNTDQIVMRYCKKYKRCRLIRQTERRGKAAAINAFLRKVHDEVVVIESADTIPRPHTIERLCAPLIRDKKIGMTGGAPIPVNDPDTFLGYIIHTWWWFHRHIPRFGEIIAYRNILKDISPKTAVDEAFIQAKLIQSGYKIVHVDEAVVSNKGPETVADLVRQRRRIFNGHARLHLEEKVKIDNMTKTSLRLLLVDYKIKSVKHLLWFSGGIAIEAYARLLGYFDSHMKNINPYIWDIARTTKNLKKDPRKNIVFLNFAPIQFMGGAERWMHDVSSETGTRAKTMLVDVHPKIANIYGRLVLGQEFHNRANGSMKHSPAQHYSLTLGAFIPFTGAWKISRAALRNADMIYMRYELLETLIVLHFGGLSALKKTVAGIHSPFVYRKPKRLLDHIHNAVYASVFSKFMLRCMNKVHVLNSQHKQFFDEVFRLKNVVFVPNYALNSVRKLKLGSRIEPNKLLVAFVGELNMRKGTDVLINTIKASSSKFNFHIAGSGPMKDQVEEVSLRKNVKYHGYMESDKLSKLYAECDVLFAPSRAESFSLVSLEAMSHGLPIISSPETMLDLPSYVQEINREDTLQGYNKMFHVKLASKQTQKLTKQKIKVHEYAKKTFSRDQVMSQLLNQVFEISKYEKSGSL